MTLDKTIDRICKGAFSDEVPYSGYVPPPALIPDPAHKTSSLLLVAFVTAQSPESRKTAIFRPSATMRINRHGKLISFRNFREAGDQFPSLSWSTPLAMWPHQAAGGMTVKAYTQKRDALLEMYEAELASFPKTRAVSPAFADSWRLIAHPVVLPFLKELAPHFHQAVSGASAEAA